MKQVFHWFNFAFCLLLAGLGVLMIVFRGEALEKPTSTGAREEWPRSKDTHGSERNCTRS